MKRKTCMTIAGVTLFVLLIISSGAMADCLSPANPVVAENCLTGNDPSEWDISGAGDLSIQGFATDISVDQGETVSFKIKTDATSYHIDIYRLGYYGGMGARKVAGPINVLSPPSQPACLSDTGTGLLDCGNWTESASWLVPVNATSGIYLAKLVRDDSTPGASHIVFIVRDDNGGSDILFQTSDTTWQAYNRYGGNSLYTGSASNPPVGRAHKVSYNRPFTTRDAPTEDWLFNAEYPMVRWLERNGYDVSYFTDVDTDRLGTELLEHKVFLSVGHDEYWSAAQRANVEAARNAGVHLAFFSGNEIYWKVRWEDSVDGSNTLYRTLVCYKEGTLGEINCGGKCDPLPNIWTGLWRDGCPPTYAPNDGCRPENELSGQISWVGSTNAIVVPEVYSNHPFWRNTTIADLLPGQSATLASGTLGYEWDPYQAQYSSFYPPGIVWLSSTSLSGMTHHLSLYQHNSGAKVFGAGTVQWSWGLDSNHDRGSVPEDVRMQQATINLLGFMGVQPANLQPNLVPFVPCVPDCTGRECGDDGCGGSCGSCTPGVTTCNALGQCVACDPNRCAGLECGDDNCGGTCGTCPPSEICQEETGLCEPPSCPCSLWNDSTMPADVTHGDTQAIEVGVRFQTEVDGYITGIRFYKTSLNNGAHVGRLWANDGTLLGTVNFAGETASGWQQAMFDSPIPVTANTTYVASYHSPVGQYAIDEYYFAKENDFITFPLRALADGVAGGSNGIYVYSATPAFPTATWHASNYWVDVVFDVTAVDLQPPTVLTRTPSAGASGVSTTTTVRATFSEPVQQATITFELRDPGSNLVPSTVSYDAPTRTAMLTPDAELDSSTSYTATVSGVRDLADNIMTAPDTWSFTTGAPPPPPPDEGPGGPILVIASSSNPFTRYYAEILRTEGLNYFTVTDISLVDANVLADYDVVILGEMSLTSAQVIMLSEWVNAGGNLTAMRPDKQLAGLLGLTDAGSTLSNAYLLVNTASGPGAGIVSETIQYHGVADQYNLNGATALATLYSNSTTATAYPAVTLRSVGSNGGQAAAFTYDLARSVVYTRQGNPAWINTERDMDATNVIRADDMFFGPPTDPPSAPEWVDRNKLHIPQADEQQRLLANLILEMNADREPLPRFWYFPKGFKAVIVMTGDDHGSGNTAPRFERYLEQSPPGCSVDDWECVRASSYMDVGVSFTNAQAANYDALGFEVSIHVTSNCSNYTESQLDGYFTNQMSSWQAKFPSIPPPSTHRLHCGAWSDWVAMPRVELGHGIRADMDYYYWVGWPPNWLASKPGMFTGSGIPMRFADLDGTIIDNYQVTTQMTDESGQSYPFTSDALLDKALGPEGYYGAFCANMHTDYASHPSSDVIVEHALARGVPVVSGRQIFNWLDGRNGSSFGNISWSGTVLSFAVTVGSGARNLTAMVPTQSAIGPLAGITRAGNPVTYETETIKGVEYALFLTGAGDYEAHYAIIDTTPPTGTITVNSGASYTKSTSVTLTFSCADTESGCSQMRFSNDNTTWSTPEAYAITKAWTLTSGNGTKTVYVKFKDNAGNWSTAYSDTIILDTVAPTTTASPPGGTYNISKSVSLNCSDGSGSGCDKIYYTTDGSTPTTSSPVYSSPINISTTTTLKFFAVDNAVNQETVKTEIYTIDTTLPTGTITINSGATYTKSISVTLTLSCTDTGGSCTQMHFSNNYTTWSTPEAYATTKAWTLTSGDGTKTVYASFKDNAGNWSTVYSDTIVLDTAVPTTIASPAGGTYTSAQGVTLNCSDGSGSGCDKIYYTTDGSTPTTSSPVYSSPISISTTTTLKFFASDLAGNQESVKTEQYTITIMNPDISVSPASHDFGNIARGHSSVPKTFTISNTGTANLVVSSIGMAGGDAGMFSVATGGPNPCLSLTPTIAPGGNCTINATFSPTSTGAKSTTMRIISNDLDENPSNIPLSGTGTPIVECTLVPDNSVVPKGGTLGVQATAKNNTVLSQTFLFATNVTLPSGNKYPASGYLFGPISITLSENGSRTGHLSHAIPLTAPPGTYIYHGYVGNYGVGIYHECTFEFTVTAP